MKRKTTLWMIGGAGVVALAAVGILNVPTNVEPTSPPQAEPVLGSLAKANLERLAENRAQTEKQLATKTTEPEKKYRTHSQKTVNNLLKGTFAVHASRRMFNRDQLQGAEIEQMAKDPEIVELAYETATDYKFAIETYGDEQAFARVTSLRLIRHLADHGHPEYLEEAVTTLGEQLNAIPAWEKGIEFDYVELLSAHIRRLGLESIMQNPQVFFDNIHLTGRTSLEVQKAFSDSGILRGAEQPKIDMLAAYFPTISSKEGRP